MNRSDGIAGLILCGGRATRMGGGDKCLLRLGASTVLGQIIDRASAQVGQIAISANGDEVRFAGFGLPVLKDPIEGRAGPLAGILAGLDWFSQSGDWRAIVSLAGDTPFIPADLVTRLAVAASDENNVIAVATSRGRTHPVIALWPVSLRDDLRRFLSDGEDRSVRGFASRHAVVDVAFDDTDLPGGRCDPFFNINRPDELVAADRLLKGPSA